MCADGAWEQFHRLGWDKPQPEFAEVHYQNHFDAARNHCFMEIVTLANNGTTQDVILDAFEGKWYGKYMQTVKGGSDCEVLYVSLPIGV